MHFINNSHISIRCLSSCPTLSPHRFVTIITLCIYILRAVFVCSLLPYNKGYGSLDLYIPSKNYPRLKLHFLPLAIKNPIFWIVVLSSKLCWPPYLLPFDRWLSNNTRWQCTLLVYFITIQEYLCIWILVHYFQVFSVFYFFQSDYDNPHHLWSLTFYMHPFYGSFLRIHPYPYLPHSSFDRTNSTVHNLSYLFLHKLIMSPSRN